MIFVSSFNSGKEILSGKCLVRCLMKQQASTVTRHWYQVTNRGASSLADPLSRLLFTNTAKFHEI